MGIIQRQSLKGTLVYMVGSLIQFGTMVLLVPNVLGEADQAIFRVYASLIFLFSTFGYLGANALVIRHLHEYEHLPQHRKVLNGVTLVVTIFGALLSVCLIFASKTVIYELKGGNNPYLLTYFWCVPVSVFFSVIQGYFECYSIATHRITAPSIVREIILRGMFLLAIISYHYSWITIKGFFVWFTIGYAVSAVTNMLYCIAVRNFRISLSSKFLNLIPWRKYVPYAFFVFLIAGFAAIMLNVDQPIVYSMLGAKSVDIYGSAVTLAAMVTIPYKPLSSILLPFMYEAWHNKDMEKLNKISRESSVNLTIVGTVLLVLLLANLPTLFQFLPTMFEAMYLPLMILGIGRVLDFTTGASTEMVLSSPTYKYLAWFMAASVLLSLICYKVFVPAYGAIGAACVVSGNLLFFNCLKFWHLYKRYKLQPLHITSFYVILLGIGIYFAQLMLPHSLPWLLDLVVRSFVICLAFAVAAFRGNWVPFFTDIVHKALLKKKLN
jgi:O-antigen/teichoic acid export membrane protein